MAFRVLLIESSIDVKVKLNNLILVKEGRDIWVPLDDISIIVLDNLTVNITARTLCMLAEKGIELIICNQEHLPCGDYGPVSNHSRASKVIGYQINGDKTFYDALWKKIVISKISNQRKLLEILHKSSDAIGKINDFEKEVMEGDLTNREAHAAKVYFNTLMDTTFSRGNDDIIINSGLDYGYAVIRAYIARLCVAYGLNTQLGIHHKNEYNRFNLVDDLMEPFRPFVDYLTYTIMKDDKYFKAEHRRRLVNILNHELEYRGKKMYLCNAMEDYVEQIASLIINKNREIVFPDINCFEVVNEI